jgi:hypothetical protein
VLQERFTAFEFHVIDDIDQYQRHAALIGDVAVKVEVLGWQ